MNYNNLARSYKSVSVETASPGKLILMLFDGALRFMAAAEQGYEIQNERARIECVNNNVIKAQNIIAELQGCLNMDVEGEFSITMYRLYDYVYRKLMDANLQKDGDALKESEHIIKELRDAWAEMLTKQEVEKASAMPGGLSQSA